MLNKSFKRPDIIRPPSEWKSYFLPLTSGCSNSSCTFCGYYGSKLRLRSVEEVKQEIDALAMFINYGIRLPAIPDIAYQVARGWDGEKLFLQDGDALIYPFPKLVEVLQYLNQKLPDLERVAIYATPQDILRRSRDELSQLKELKLGIFYMGVESGDSEVLEKIGKGVNYDQMVGAGRKAIEAGITLSATVILGLGGIEGSERHSLETARILSDIDPEYGGALTLTLIPGTPLYQQAQNGDFHPISPFRSLEELKIIVENSHFTNCFFSSVHASNYFSIRGTLPYDKEKMLGQLEAVLKAREPSLLRPEFLRGL
jgi:radical SAM superfamily enzyme YgiQ (UPF0313 family)